MSRPIIARDDPARAYIELAHSIECHLPGYIDGYHGPDAWRVETTRPLADLADDAERLREEIEVLDDPSRRAFLGAQACAMQTTIALLRGEPIPYRDEVRRLYGVEAERVAEEEFESALTALDALLPGRGDLNARMQALRDAFVVPAERLPGLIEAIAAELRRRTRTRFGLPVGESFEVAFVTDKHWGAYNWYLGGLRSLVEINTDLPSRLFSLPDIVAHEAYPGHHTEHAIKEARLLQEGRLEHSLLLINAPECVVSEGVAQHARARVMSDEELRDWFDNDLLALAGLTRLTGDEVERMLAVTKEQARLRAVTGNAALLLHDEGEAEAAVLAYLERYGLMTPVEAAKRIEFIRHPLARSYSFTYTVGAALLDALFDASAGRAEVDAWFARLLAEPVTPAGIRRWIDGERG